MKADQTLDAVGLLCPLPVLRTRKRLQTMAGGEILEVVADDPASVIDVPHFCTEAGHALLEMESGAKRHRFWIQKGS